MTQAETIGALWRRVRDRLRAAGVVTPELDAKRLVAFALGVRDVELSLRGDHPIPSATDIDAMVARRLAGEPIARIVGEQEFYGLTFALNAATLVPRPETELVVDLTLGALAVLTAPRLLDLGTGSGCIAVAVLANCHACLAVGVDLNPQALVAARENAVRHGVADRLNLREGSWLAAIALGERFDVVAANPPYVEHAELGRLMVEVRDHDPRLALDGGPDGLVAYRDILAGVPRVLEPGGRLLLEIGNRQAGAVGALCEEAGFSDISVKQDLAGLDRVVVAHHLR